MREEIEILRQYVEALNLHEKTEITQADLNELCETLEEGDELGLSTYVKQLKNPAELGDLIVNTLYG